MTYKLFIDDERFPPANQGEWVIVRSSQEAIDMFEAKGAPSFISFDHDLGGEDTSMVFVRWMIDFYLDRIEAGLEVPDFPGFYVHSQNPVGARNLNNTLTAFYDFLDRVQKPNV